MFSILLKWKIWRIEAALRGMLREGGIQPRVWSFGAYYLDPKRLVFVVGVTSDEERDRLRLDSAFNEKMKDLLRVSRWPSQAIDFVEFDIESQETVVRETGGNWWHHYK